MESEVYTKKAKLQPAENQVPTDPTMRQEGQEGQEGQDQEQEKLALLPEATDYRAKLRSSTRASTPLEMRKLQTYLLCSLQTFNDPTIQGTTHLEHAEFIFLQSSVQMKEPETFNEAWFHNDPDEKEGWRNTIEKELSDMYIK
jgi:hypothetical protein